jgi:hypothetical protein
MFSLVVFIVGVLFLAGGQDIIDLIVSLLIAIFLH